MLIRTVYPLALMLDRVELANTIQPIYEVELGIQELERLIVTTIVAESDYFDFERCKLTNRVGDLRVFVNVAGTQTWLHDTYNNGAGPEHLGHSLEFPEAEADNIRDLVELAAQKLQISRESMFEVGIPKRVCFDRFPSHLTFPVIDQSMRQVKASPESASMDALAWGMFLGKATLLGIWRDLLPRVKETLDKLPPREFETSALFFANLENLEFELSQRADRGVRNLRDLLDRFPNGHTSNDGLEMYLDRFSDDELAEIVMLAFYTDALTDVRLKLILFEVESRMRFGRDSDE